MLDAIGTPDRAEAWVRDAVLSGDRIMGFGHRVYKTDDPRSVFLREVARSLGGPLVDFAEQVERTTVAVLAELKPGRQLYTNVEFFAGVVMHTCGIPREMFTPTFACSRTIGWCYPCHGTGGGQPPDPAGGPLRRPTASAAGPHSLIAPFLPPFERPVGAHGAASCLVLARSTDRKSARGQGADADADADGFSFRKSQRHQARRRGRRDGARPIAGAARGARNRHARPGVDRCPRSG